MTSRVRYRAAALPAHMAELRLLVELSSVRALADRGLSDQELALVNRLADATMRAARRGDAPGYVRADMHYHLGLVELTGDPARCGIARLLFVPDPVPAPCGGDSDFPMALEAREHRELIGLVANGMTTAADHLLRLHLSRPSAGQSARSCLAEPEPINSTRG
jgi:DNA-binding GntR family transcriptional regulator